MKGSSISAKPTCRAQKHSRRVIRSATKEKGDAVRTLSVPLTKSALQRDIFTNLLKAPNTIIAHINNNNLERHGSLPQAETAVRCHEVDKEGAALGAHKQYLVRWLPRGIVDALRMAFPAPATSPTVDSGAAKTQPVPGTPSWDSALNLLTMVMHEQDGFSSSSSAAPSLPSASMHEREKVLTICVCLLQSLESVVDNDASYSMPLALQTILRSLLLFFMEELRKIHNKCCKKIQIKKPLHTKVVTGDQKRILGHAASGVQQTPSLVPPLQLAHPAEFFAQSLSSPANTAAGVIPTEKPKPATALRLPAALRAKRKRRASTPSEDEDSTESSSSESSDDETPLLKMAARQTVTRKNKTNKKK